jgi:hypothetical protein
MPSGSEVRDIKLRRWMVKVLDFGLAKPLEPRGQGCSHSAHSRSRPMNRA